jgi:hypothetical protein
LKDNRHITNDEFVSAMSRDKAQRPTLPAAKRLVVLASPSYCKQRAATYARMPRTSVQPLIFKWSKLSAAQIKILMGISQGDSQLHVNVLLRIFRWFQVEVKVPGFKSFKQELLESMGTLARVPPCSRHGTLCVCLTRRTSTCRATKRSRA